MKLFTQQIDEQAEKSLESALGKNVGFLFPEVEISTNSEGFSTSSVSISLDYKSYLIINNDWADTHEEAIEYYFLSASLSDMPKDIKVTKHDGRGWLHHQASTLHTWDYNFVSKITNYEFCDFFGLESVQYDAAILFEFENKTQILISTEKTIAGSLEINFKPHIIRETLETLALRKVMTSTVGRNTDAGEIHRNPHKLKMRY